MTLPAWGGSPALDELRAAAEAAAAAAADADAAVDALTTGSSASGSSGPLRLRRYRRGEPFIDFDLSGIDVRVRGNVKLQLVSRLLVPLTNVSIAARVQVGLFAL